MVLNTLPIKINIFGICVEIYSAIPEINDALHFDFKAFITDSSTHAVAIRVEANLVDPSIVPLPQLEESMRGDAFIAYDHNGIRYIDYGGRVLLVHDQRTEDCKIYGSDNTYLYERLYLFLLSRIGELLEKRGLKRIHALGLAVNGNGSLILLPSGGGKSTLLLELAKDAYIKFLSDDMPLINSKCELLPFPLRIGVSKGEAPDWIPDEKLRTFERSRFGAKTLIRFDAFDGKWQKDPVPLRNIIVAKRSTHELPQVRALSKFGVLKALFRDMVFGLGLPQVVELFLLSGLKGFVKNTSLFCKRGILAFKMVLNSEAKLLILGKNKEANAKLLNELLNT